MLTKAFWLGENGAIVRAIRTAAQTAIAAIGVGQTNLFSADIKNVAALSVSAAILSILMSLDRNSPHSQPAAVPADANYIPPATLTSGCGGDLR